MATTPVGIVGAGPAGLTLALELGQRGIECIVFEEDTSPPWFPKANSSTARTMEHFRRLGVSREIRGAGLPPDYPQDVAYFTRFTGGWQLARLHGRSRGEVQQGRAHDDPAWPTPEPVHRTNQIYIESVLKRHVEQYPCVALRFGWRVLSMSAHANHVDVDAAHCETGEELSVRCQYVAGCDGPRSLVRKTLGVEFEGVAGEKREFMGGSMLASLLEIPGFYEVMRNDRSWQYVAVNAERRGILIAIDGRSRFTMHTQLPSPGSGSQAWVEESLRLLLGRALPVKVVAMAEWTAGFTLVAQTMQAERVFLVGDAAHLFTPTGGLGYNTSVDDACNLGWKLAAVLKGWARPPLLESYGLERQPIARRNTAFARRSADTLGGVRVTPQHEHLGAEGNALRDELGAHLDAHARAEFNTAGIQLGVFYGQSPAVVGDGSPPPLDDPHRYEPSSVPGARAPHLWIEDEVCLYDRLGSGFTLICRDGAACTAFSEEAARRCVPLTRSSLPAEQAGALYPRRYTLVRPDQHVAWRGDNDAEAAAILRQVTGHAD